MAICTWKLATTKNSQHGTFLMYSLFNTPDSDHQPVMRVAWSPVWSFHSQWWFGLPCHLLVLVHCVFWSPQSTQSSTRTRALHASFCWQRFMEMLISFSSRTWHLHTLPKVPKAGSMTMCYCAWLASKLAWPELYRESRWETPDPTMQMTWRPLLKKPGLHYTWAVPRTDHLHATLHWCSNSCNQVLSA